MSMQALLDRFLGSSTHRAVLIGRWGELTLAQARALDPSLWRSNPLAPWAALVEAGERPAALASLEGPFWTARLARAMARVDPLALALNPSVPWDGALLHKLSGALTIPRLAANPGVPWGAALVMRYRVALGDPDPAWHPDLAWEPARWLNASVRLSDSGWRHLQQNPGARWGECLALLSRLLPKPDWSLLSRNPGLPWSVDFVNQNGHLIDMGLLSHCRGAFWDVALLEALWEQLSPPALAQNPTLPWSEALLERLKPSLARLSQAGRVDAAALAAYADQWDWRALSANPALPWSEALIEQHEARWDWAQLSSNPSPPWSAALLGRYGARWSLDGLCRNPVAGALLAAALRAPEEMS